jgi:antitoxin component of MazEF toxin-antitoxin module
MAKHVQAVRRWGNSRAVIISRRVQDQITWPLRELVHVSVEDDAIVLRPVSFPRTAVHPPRLQADGDAA